MSPSPSFPQGPPAELLNLPSSARLGKFIRADLLGRGGCGDVYKAWDTELNRWVALKFLRSDDDAESARLRREAQTAARLSHPNICAVYEVAVHEGRPFIAMQYIDGSVLSSSNEIRKSVRFIRDAALAVHYAHLQGVIHRDLKPANLMLEIHHVDSQHEGSSANRPAPTGPRVYVMDFGLAKQTASASSLSASGVMVGTPSYMPPEQARGENNAIDARSDVYSLGATLFELATGRAPFLGTNPVDIAMQIVDAEPPAPRKLKPSIDADLETILLKCLEKEPDRRYASAEALASDLTRWLAGEPILAHPPSTLYRFRKSVRKHRVPVLIGVGAILTVAAILGTLVPRVLADRRARDVAERRQAALQDLNRLWAEFLVVREWSRQPFREPAAIAEARVRAMDGIRGFVSKHPELAVAWYVQTRALLHDGRLAEATSAAEETLKLDATFEPARATLSQIHLEGLRRRLEDSLEDDGIRSDELEAKARQGLATLSDTSSERYGLARTEDDAVTQAVWAAAIQAIVRQDREGAVKQLHDAHRKSPSEELCSWMALFSDSRVERTKWIEEAVRIAPHWVPGRIDRAVDRYNNRRFHEAETDASHAIALDPRQAFPRGLRATINIHLRKLDAAIADFDRAIELDDTHPKYFTGRGAARKELGDLEGAIKDHTQALKLRPDYAIALGNRGMIHALKRDRDATFADMDLAIRLRPHWHGGYVFRGNAKAMFGDIEGAIRDYDEAVAIAPRDYLLRINRGDANRQLGRIRAALDDFSAAIDAWPDGVDGRTNRGLLRRETGDFRGSLEDFDHLISVQPRNAEAWTNRGKTKHAMRNLDGSIADHTRATELRPDYPEAWYNRALAKAAKGDRSGAIADYTTAIDRRSTYADAFTNRGMLRLNAGDSEGALDDQKRAVEIDPASPTYRVNLGVVLNNRGDPDGAVEQWERALKLAPPAWPYRSRVQQMIREARD